MTINKTSDLDNNTDTLKKLTAADKPIRNNQTKVASIGGAPLAPSQMKCNILKGMNHYNYLYCYYFYFLLHF